MIEVPGRHAALSRTAGGHPRARLTRTLANTDGPETTEPEQEQRRQGHADMQCWKRAKPNYGSACLPGSCTIGYLYSICHLTLSKQKYMPGPPRRWDFRVPSFKLRVVCESFTHNPPVSRDLLPFPSNAE